MQLQDGRESSLERAVAAALLSMGELFQQNVTIGPWLVDFYLPMRRLVVECDGRYWHGLAARTQKDRSKNWWLREHKYNVLRLVSDRAIQARAAEILQLAIDPL